MCEQDWEENGNHCYFWSTESKSWDEAEQFCKEEGGHLASVTSNATDDYIEAKLKERDHNLWIGGSDRASEGDWKWTDGSSWKFTNWGKLNGIQQPGHSTGQNCLAYFIENRKWNDWVCFKETRFLCSKKLCSGKHFKSIQVCVAINWCQS